jgi:serine/threonine protein phosphatase PrpC
MARTVANWGAATNPGLVRSNNEDSVFAQFPVFVVADGMGGTAGGEVASALASEEFRALAASPHLTIDEVSRTIERANRAVVETAESVSGLAGMGTTLVGLALVEDKAESRWLAFNVGDSRIYRFAADVLTQVTTDHTEVQFLIDRGAIPPEAARTHPHRHVITRAIGTEPTVEPDYWLLPPEPGERFLICSDGLTADVDDAGIAAVLRAEADPTVAATRLVERAVASGGHDNISAVVVDVMGVDEADDVDTMRPEELTVTRVPVSRDAGAQAPAQAEPLVVDVPVTAPPERAGAGEATAPPLIAEVPKAPTPPPERSDA